MLCYTVFGTSSLECAKVFGVLLEQINELFGLDAFAI